MKADVRARHVSKKPGELSVPIQPHGSFRQNPGKEQPIPQAGHPGKDTSRWKRGDLPPVSRDKQGDSQLAMAPEQPEHVL
jgi:hypothetical protein